MAEYLSPGVYVEELDSGLKPMEGVSTSTAGFVGMTQRGPVVGVPEFVGSFGEFQRKFGGYLPKEPYGDRRFLPMAVEQFFANGGSRCFVVRLLEDTGSGTASAKTRKASIVKAEEKTSTTTGGTTGATTGGTGDATTGGTTGATTGGTTSATTGGTTGATTGGTTGETGSATTGGTTSAATGETGSATTGETTGATTGGTDKKTEPKDCVIFTASSAGDWGNNMKILCKKDAMKEALCTLTVISGPNAGDYAETYNEVSLDPNDENYVCRLLEKSLLVRAKYEDPSTALTGGLYALFPKENSEKDARVLTFSGGADGFTPQKEEAKEKTKENKKKVFFNAATLKGKDGGPGKRTGLCALLDTDEVSIVVCPGVTDAAEIQEIVTHCENTKNRVCILDMEQGVNNVKSLQTIRGGVSSSYAAMYHPWIQVFDPLEKRAGYIPPSGSIAGIYARSDNTRGVHKAPANEVVRNCTGLETLFGKAEQDMLNPVGVNLIRKIQGLGFRVWGARTCSSDSSWKYINVRRLFIFIEETIRNSTGWAVFEPNDQVLWTKVRASVSSFLNTQWRNGALAGATEAEAYYVNVGKGSTMTQDDILNGRLICEIGIAPVRPAEFVIFRLTQIMEQNA